MIKKFEPFVRNRQSELSKNVELIYEMLSLEYGYTARVSMIWEMLAKAFGIPEFEIMDFNLFMNGSFDSYLNDCYRDWYLGKDIDFSLIADAVMTGDFTASEKLLMLDGNNLAERLWAIFKVISDPSDKLNTL